MAIIPTVLINGTPLDDELFGTAQNDILNANWSDGDDDMHGSKGDDIYKVNSTGDQVFEFYGEGDDLVISRVKSYYLAAAVERLTLDNNDGPLSTAVEGIGNHLDNVIYGNDRFNTLSGGDGSDTISGGNGNDTLDGGNGHDKLYGNNGDDTLSGGAGSDTLDGGTGNDKMAGGFGNDTYHVDAAGDVVVEGPLFGGVDRVIASVSETLDANVENLTLHGLAGAINGTGNGLSKGILGNNSADVLQGLGGNDTLDGAGGNDIVHGGSGSDNLRGGGGNDVLAGGSGNDKLTGGWGLDRFQFADRGAANGDAITDFNHADDTIVLMNALDAGLAGAVSPGIQGLLFSGGNVAGNALHSAWFFKGAGYDGNGSQLSGIFVNSDTGQLWYNPTTFTAGDSQYLGSVNLAAVAAVDATDFVYG